MEPIEYIGIIVFIAGLFMAFILQILNVRDIFPGIGFMIIAWLTWFFSSRRKLFLKCFTLPGPGRLIAHIQLPDEKAFKKICRGFAIFEFVIGVIILLVTLYKSNT